MVICPIQPIYHFHNLTYWWEYPIDDIYVETIVVLLGQRLMLGLNLNPEENHIHCVVRYREDSVDGAKPLKSCHETFQLMVTLDFKHFISRLAHGALAWHSCL